MSNVTGRAECRRQLTTAAVVSAGTWGGGDGGGRCGTPRGTLPGWAQCCHHSTLGDPGVATAETSLMEHVHRRLLHLQGPVGVGGPHRGHSPEWEQGRLRPQTGKRPLRPLALGGKDLERKSKTYNPVRETAPPGTVCTEHRTGRSQHSASEAGCRLGELSPGTGPVWLPGHSSLSRTQRGQRAPRPAHHELDELKGPI